MLNKVYGALAGLALAGLFLFYSNEIWIASISPHQATYYIGKNATNHKQQAENILVAFWGWVGDVWDWTTHDAISFYTAILCLFTGVLAFVSFVQINYLRRADVIAGNSASAAQSLAIAAKEQSTRMGDWTAIAAAQTDIQTKQHAVGRLQYLATHRPRLRIRHVTVCSGSPIENPEFFDGTQVKGVVVNIGGFDATIVNTRYRIFFSKFGLPAEAPYDQEFRGNLLLAGQILVAGESCAAPIFDTIITESPPPGIEAVDAGNCKVYVMGQIRYRDSGGTERFMGFCRERRTDGRFRAVEDPDYEYED